MRIHQLILRQHQQSIVRDERSELVAIFEVSHENVTGKVVLEQYVDKRDVENEWSTDSPELGASLTEADLMELDKHLWLFPPLRTKQDKTTNHIRCSARYAVEIGRPR